MTQLQKRVTMVRTEHDSHTITDVHIYRRLWQTYTKMEHRCLN